MTDKTGGSAFPGFNPGRTQGQLLASGGMTLRDYFAAKAMQGYLVAFGAMSMPSHESIAAYAYKQADAMLNARGESNE